MKKIITSLYKVVKKLVFWKVFSKSFLFFISKFLNTSSFDMSIKISGYVHLKEDTPLSIFFYF